MRKDFTTSVVRPFFACLLEAIGIGRVEVASRAYLGHLPGRIVQGVGSGFDRCAEGSSFTGFATLSVLLEACFDPSTINDLSQATIFAPDRVVNDVCCVRCQNPCCVPDSGKVCKSLFRNRAGDRSNERSVASAITVLFAASVEILLCRTVRVGCCYDVTGHIVGITRDLTFWISDTCELSSGGAVSQLRDGTHSASRATAS